MAQPSSSTAAPRRLRPGRPGRPTADEAQAIDTAIRAAALKLFLEAGFEATGMDAIAAASLVSKGTLYARYESKEQLFRAVIEEEIERFSAMAGLHDDKLPADLEGLLRHHARVLVDVFNSPRFQRVSRAMQAALLTFPDLGRLWQDIGTERYLRLLTRDIARTIEGRRLSAEDCAAAASLFLYALAGWRNLQSVTAVASEGVLDFAERVIGTIARSIR